MADQVQFLYGGFRRLGAFLLDPDSVFETKENMLTYLATSPMVVPGMQLIVWNDSNPENNGTYVTKKPDINDKNENIRGNFAITETPAAISKELKAEIEILSTNIETISKKVESVSENVDEIQTFFSGSEGQSGLTLPKISEAIKELQALVTGKDDIDGKSAFEEIQEEIDATDEKVDKNTADIEDLKAQIGINGGSSENLSTKIEKVSSDINEINTKIGKINIILDLLDNNMNDNSLTLEIEKLTHTFNSLKAEMDALEAKLREDLLSSDAIIEINNRLSSLESTASSIPDILSSISDLQAVDGVLRNDLDRAFTDISSLNTNYQNLSKDKAGIQYVNEEILKLNTSVDSKVAAVQTDLNKFKDNISSNIETFISYDGVRRTHNFDIVGNGKAQTHWCTGDNVAMHHVGDTLNKITIQVKAAPENFDEDLDIYSNYTFKCLIGNQILFDEDDIIFSDIGSFYEFLINQKITEELNNFGFSVNLPSSVTIGISVDYIGAKKTSN